MYSVKSHLASATHVANEKKASNTAQTFFKEASTSKNRQFASDLCKAFICTDIPLFKVLNEHLKSFLSKYVEHQIPSETTLRGNVSNIYKTTIDTIKNCIKNENIWVSIDETTESSGRFVANVVIGVLSADEQLAKQRFLLNTALLEKTNNSTIARLFDDSIKILGETFDKDTILLYITDAAPYMCKSAEAIKVFYPKVLHLTCVAHALHRVCEKIRECHPQVHRLISCIKKIFLKAPSRNLVFKQCEPEIPLPPEPIITRWGTWLEAVSYYAKYFEKLQPILENFDSDESKFIKDAKLIMADPGVRQQIIYVDSNFNFLIAAIKKLETVGLPLKDQVKMIEDVKKKNLYYKL